MQGMQLPGFHHRRDILSQNEDSVAEMVSANFLNVEKRQSWAALCSTGDAGNQEPQDILDDAKKNYEETRQA